MSLSRPHIAALFSFDMRLNPTALNWLINFTVVNVLLFWLAGLPYFSFLHIPAAETLTQTGIVFTWLFFIFSYLGQLSLLVLVPYSVLLGPLLLLRAKPRLLMICGALLAAGYTTLLFIDIYLYKFYHFHINGSILQLVLLGGAQEILGLSLREWLLPLAVFCMLLIPQYLLSVACWEKIKLQRWPYFPVLISVPPTALFLSYALFFCAAAQAEDKDLGVITNTHTLTMQSPILPFYHHLLAVFFPVLSLEEVSRTGEGIFIQPTQITKPLLYPLHPLRFTPPTPAPNILIIGLDAWRYDMMTPKNTPHIYAFSKQCLQFKNHFSGGNATEPGLFSLFYSIPSTYWSSMLAAKQGPLLIHTLLQQQYQLGMFVSAEIYNPPYNKTLFREIPSMPLSTPGEEPYQRDAYITQAFQQFIKQSKPQQPFFSFVFYNTTHSYCTANNYPQPFTPATQECDRLLMSNHVDPTPLRNRYKNAVYYVDSLVGEILTTLQKEKRLDNTIVFILGDHGEEFNDNHLDYWGHASNFTRYQTQTPLLVYWPGKKARSILYQTSHYDIVPTLFKHLFQCKNPTSDYSVGFDLFRESHRPYLVVGSYIDFGIVESGRITRILPGGNLEVLDSYNRVLNAQPPIHVIKQAFTDTQRFYTPLA